MLKCINTKLRNILVLKLNFYYFILSPQSNLYYTIYLFYNSERKFMYAINEWAMYESGS